MAIVACFSRLVSFDLQLESRGFCQAPTRPTLVHNINALLTLFLGEWMRLSGCHLCKAQLLQVLTYCTRLQ